THPRQTDHDSASEQTARTTRSMADAAERTARSGAEAMARNADAVSATWRGGSEAASRMAERSMDQFSKMFGFGGETARQAAQQSAANVQALMEGSTIVAGAVHDVSGEWLRFVQIRTEQNMDHFDQLLGCRSLQECFALQTQMLRDNFEALLQSARRASEL